MAASLQGSAPRRRVLAVLWAAPRSLPILVLGFAACVILMVGIFAPIISPHDPIKLDMAKALRAPASGAWFGTDEVGRDILSRVIWGTRLSIAAAAGVLGIALSIGVVLGAISGYGGGYLDQAIMRLTDLFLAFPSLILAIAVTAALGPSLWNAVISIGIVWWPAYARLVRGQVLSVKEHTYVEAARALGLPEIGILFKHVLPQCWGIIVVRVTLDIGYAILLTAGLSFLGLGSKPPTPEWGSMIANSSAYFLTYWWTATFPGMAMFVTVLVFSLFGDALYETYGFNATTRRILV